MANILTRLLEKRGIKDATELQGEEKTQFEKWRAILSKEELTTEDIKQFCQQQVGIIESKWKDYALKNESKAELIPYHIVYKTLLAVIDGPKVAREQLEKYLNELINK